MKIFRERLKELRLENNLSQKQLAEHIGVSDVAICRWESGLRIPNAENIKNIALYFGISSDYLLGLED